MTADASGPQEGRWQEGSKTRRKADGVSRKEVLL